MARTGYLIVIYQDVNPSSPTYNQTREERTQSEEFCPSSAPAHWIEDTKYCELTENGMLTGYEITVYRDVEPLSSTYNQTREERELNLTDCEADNVNPNWQNIGDPFCRQIAYMPSGLMGNDGYMIQQQQDMNEYSPTADEIREIATLDLVNCPLPDTEPDWEIVYEACHVIKQDELLVFDGTKDVVRIERNPYSPYWNDNVPEAVNIEDLVNCPPNVIVEYRWIVVTGQHVCDGYDKYRLEKKQQSIDGGTTWTDVVPSETRTGSLVERNSEDCGYEPTIEYRWIVVTGQHICVGFDKYTMEKKQQSTDGGQTWTDVVPSETKTGSLIEADSEDCGYVEPQYRWVVISGTFVCVGFDKHEQEKQQVSYDNGQTWTDVVPENTRTGSLIEADSEDCGYDPTYEYRWVEVSGSYQCVGNDKYSLEKQQVSTDGGQTWTDTGNTRAGTLIEVDSTDCGYVPTDFSTQYLTFEAIEDGTFTFNGRNSNALSYTIDGGQTWTALASGTASPTVTSGNKIMWKGTCTPDNGGIGKFSSTGTFKAYGNTMSIVYGDNFQNSTTISNYQFKSLFNSTKVVNAHHLVLPSTIMKSDCYFTMFEDCTSLTTAPELPATTLASRCYFRMFGGCTSLITAPALPVTTLTYQCYNQMFKGCTSLVNAPALPATTLNTSCYNLMFSGCTSLVNAPALPATTMVYGCYAGMFGGCTSLTSAPALPATTLAEYCYQDMFQGCSSLTSAPALPATTLYNYCYYHMFGGCTSLTSAPALPATTLADYCYRQMFRNCTSLTTAPELPAETLTTECYYQMLYGCTSLNYIKCLARYKSATNCTHEWVDSVAASGTFVKNSAASWTRGTSGIPTGWTIQNQ